MMSRHPRPLTSESHQVESQAIAADTSDEPTRCIGMLEQASHPLNPTDIFDIPTNPVWRNGNEKKQRVFFNLHQEDNCEFILQAHRRETLLDTLAHKCSQMSLRY
jgi:hypothetical protein